MRLTDLEMLSNEDLVSRAVEFGLTDKVHLPHVVLAREILIRAGEMASEEDLTLRFLYGEVRRLEERVNHLLDTVGDRLKRIEATADKAKFLGEAQLMGRAQLMAPRPQEVAALGSAALCYLGESLGLSSPAKLGRAELLNCIAERMGWSPWRSPGDLDQLLEVSTDGQG